MQTIFKKERQRTTVAAAVAAVLAASGTAAYAADADSAAPDSDSVVNEVVVTGNRVGGGVQAAESAAPILVMSAAELQRTGAPDLMTALATVVPSFTMQAFGGDMANQTPQAKLRGLSPNHVLVLVDGKRRHSTSNLAVLGGPYQGGAGPDWNFIPLDAIDHIEVLTEGAAAQYGSDAIAGVVNIILKKGGSGGGVRANYGSFMDQGGGTREGGGNIAYSPTDDVYFNLTADVHNHAHTMRGGIDPRVVDAGNLATFPNSNMPKVGGYPYLNLIQGDAHYDLTTVGFNSGYKVSDAFEFYLFGTWGDKSVDSFENYRLPSRISHTNPTTGAVSYMYPLGFDPEEAAHEKDYQVTAGVKGTAVGWNWDLASGYGKDLMNIYTLHSGNRSLYADTGASPQDFYDGTFIASQFSTTLDFNRNFEVGWSGPLNVAFGAEYRRDTYAIRAGQPESYYGGGAQSFPGFSPADASSHGRKNYAGYLDFNLKPIDGLTVDIAGRHEHFDDFGNTDIGKLTARYDFTPAFALRGTVSSGFRAPTLAEEYYTTVNVGPNTAYIQIPPNSAAAAAVGLGSGLKPEKSRNYSLGIVFRPMSRLVGTLDIYQIDVSDRIAGSGTLLGAVNGTVISQAVVNAALASGASIDQVRNTGINLFANGIDTRTRGADFTLSYPVDYSFGRIDWSAGATYNSTTVTKALSTLPKVPGQPLFDATALSDLTTAAPKFVMNLGMLWTYDKLSVNLREQIYGASSEWENDNADTCGLPTTSPLYTNNAVYGNVSSLCAANGGAALYYKDEIGVTPITNLEVGYQPMAGLKVTAGALNLFNRYPNGQNKTLLAIYNASTDNSAVQIYPGFSSYGINGGYYYARAVFTF